MAEFEIGQKVEYRSGNGKFKTGVIHGAQSHETPEGEVLRTAYVIDTGKVFHEHTANVASKTGKVTSKEEKVIRQNVQVVVDAEQVKGV